MPRFEAGPRPSKVKPAPFDVPRWDTTTSFRKEDYAALKRAIIRDGHYDHPHEIRLDERQLSKGLG